jgi:hypothetical protein
MLHHFLNPNLEGSAMSWRAAPRVPHAVSTLRLVVAVVVVMALAAPAAWGIWAVMPDEVPIDRHLKNATSYIQEQPKEAHGYYVIGRLHSMAFATGADRLRVSRSRSRIERQENLDALPQFLPWESILVHRANRPMTSALSNHLRESIRNYRKATELDPGHALASLGLGWVQEEASTLAVPFATPVEGPPGPLGRVARVRIQGLIVRLSSAWPEHREAATEALARELPAALPLLADAAPSAKPEARAHIEKLVTRYWQDRALAAYRRAYELSLEKDRKQRIRDPAANSMVSLDAAEAIRRILGRRPLTDADRKELGRIEEQTKDLPRGRAITPLIFSLDAAVPLESLLDRSRRVRFDLAGNDRASDWPWLHPGTALLVWDPAGTGRITSGRQLFGNVTWWVFWGHGYEPLALLDDDGDGWITGGELAGLAIWRDHNSDGHSDPGEVIPVVRAGIAGLAAHPDGCYGEIPWNPRGLATTDGRLLPTYDWTPSPLDRAGSGRPSRTRRLP